MIHIEPVSMNQRKFKVKKISVIADPISLWCGYSNQSIKNASDLLVVARRGLEPLLSGFGP